MLCLAGLLSAFAALSQAEANASQPNVVIFLADDQGWGDLSMHGNKDLATPNIDSLARDGVRFDRFYVCAVCAPTRAEFLTGRYHPRTGVTGVTRGAERMNLDERTIAEAFQAADYATGCFGKWHNGMQYPYHPRARGFDTFVGYCSGHWGDYFDAELERNGEYFQSKGYITDVVTDEAIGFIEENAKQGKPFFCYIPLPTPHSPMQVPDAYWDRFKDRKLVMDHRDDGKHTRAALAMVENIDDNVGRLLKKLDALGVAENTIVVYFSDNGPNGNRWNGGMKGKKGSVDEGGLRVPMVMRWLRSIEPYEAKLPESAAIDLLPTLTELVGIERVGEKSLDGISHANWLLLPNERDGDKFLRQRVLLDYWPRKIFSHQRGSVSLLDGSYRLDHQNRLYDLAGDPGQQSAIADDERIEKMRLEVAEWKEDVGLNEKREPRPFTVGHQDWPVTELPARDATTKGGIKRSSPHPNCSYFLNWSSTDDAIVWDAEVLTAGKYEALVYYTCPARDVGSTLELRFGDATTTGKVSEAHDPPLEGEKENRIDMRESLTKDFKPMSLGVIELATGRGEMTLRATEIPGDQAIQFRRLMLRRVE